MDAAEMFVKNTSAFMGKLKGHKFVLELKDGSRVTLDEITSAGFYVFQDEGVKFLVDPENVHSVKIETLQ